MQHREAKQPYGLGVLRPCARGMLFVFIVTCLPMLASSRAQASSSSKTDPLNGIGPNATFVPNARAHDSTTETDPLSGVGPSATFVSSRAHTSICETDPLNGSSALALYAPYVPFALSTSAKASESESRSEPTGRQRRATRRANRSQRLRQAQNGPSMFSCLACSATPRK